MDFTKIFTYNLGDYNQNAFEWVTRIVTNATTSVGLYILGILLVFEVVNIYEKANFSNSGNVTLKMFQGIAYRTALGGIMVAGSSFFVNFLMVIARGLVNLISSQSNDFTTNGSIPSIVFSNNILDGVNSLNSQDNSTTISYSILFIIGFVVSISCYLVLASIIFFRFFQLYVLMALAPIPMASFVSEEHSVIGKKFLKRIGSYAFQPAVILIVMIIFNLISNLSADLVVQYTGEDNLPGITELLRSIVMGIVFIATLWQTHRISSSLFGV